MTRKALWLLPRPWLRWWPASGGISPATSRSGRCPKAARTATATPARRSAYWRLSVPGRLRRGCSAEQRAVGVECGLPAQMGVQHGGVRTDPAGADQVDEPGHRLALVHRVDDHALQAAGKPDRVQRGAHRDAVVVPGPARQHGDLVVPQVAAQADELGGIPG